MLSHTVDGINVELNVATSYLTLVIMYSSSVCTHILYNQLFLLENGHRCIKKVLKDQTFKMHTFSFLVVNCVFCDLH